MTGLSVRNSLNLGQFSPDTQEPEERPHVCGRCRNGTGVTNPACPNDPKNRRTT